MLAVTILIKTLNVIESDGTLTAGAGHCRRSGRRGVPYLAGTGVLGMHLAEPMQNRRAGVAVVVSHHQTNACQRYLVL